VRGVDAQRSCAVVGPHELIIHIFDVKVSILRRVLISSTESSTELCTGATAHTRTKTRTTIEVAVVQSRSRVRDWLCPGYLPGKAKLDKTGQLLDHTMTQTTIHHMNTVLYNISLTLSSPELHAQRSAC
jgi:hypothetical protein